MTAYTGTRGQVVPTVEDTVVIRPDGTQVVMGSDGGYVLDVTGTHYVGADTYAVPLDAPDPGTMPVVPNLEQRLTALDARIGLTETKAVAPSTPSKNLYNKATDAGPDKFWNGVGPTPATLVGTPPWYASAKIPVTPGQQYTVTAARNALLFRADGAPVRLVNGTNEFTPLTFTVAANETHLAISVAATKRDEAQIELGATPTAREPWGLKIPNLIAAGGYLEPKLAALDKATAGTAGLVVYRTGDTILIRCPHDSTQDVVIPLSLAGSAHNPGDPRIRMAFPGWTGVRLVNRTLLDADIWPLPAVLPGYSIHDAADDNAPFFAGNTYIGGNHGFGAGSLVTIPGHNKTTADLGSQWTDGTRTYTLLRIVSATQLLFGGPYTVSSGRVTVNSQKAAANLTHVSGATNTSTVSIAGGVELDQIRPTSHSRTVAITLDGQRLGADTIARGRVLEVAETYTVVSYKALIDHARANIGLDPFLNLANRAPLARLTNTHTFFANRLHVVGQTLTPHEEFVGFMMGTQAIALTPPAGGGLRQLMPGATGTAAGLNLANENNLADMPTDVDLTVGLAQQAYPAEPINRIIQWRVTSAGTRDCGFLMGLAPVMDGKLATRKAAGTDDASWFLSQKFKKNYPRVTGPNHVFTVGQTYSVLAYRRYLSPEDPPETIIELPDGRKFVTVDTSAAVANPAVARLLPLIGRKLVDVETSTINRAKPYVTPEGITYTAPAGGHMLAEAVIDTTI